MAIPQIQPYDYFHQWRSKTNDIATTTGDIESLNVAAPDRTSLVTAVNKVISNVGLLDGLDTTDKTSTVEAINEVLSNVGLLDDLDTTDKTSTVEAINEVLSMTAIGSVVFTIGSETNDVINISAQLKNHVGDDVAFRASVFAYLSDNSNGSTLIDIPHSGGWSIGNQGLLIPVVENKAAHFTSNATGLFNIDITEVSAKTAYLVVVHPNGKITISSAITHAE
jgi:hypothetical protein